VPAGFVMAGFVLAGFVLAGRAQIPFEASVRYPLTC